MSANIPLWKEAPFLRVIAPFIAGIIFQYYFDFGEPLIWIMICSSLAGTIIFSLTALKWQFQMFWIFGWLLHAMLFATGGLFTRYNDPFAPGEVVNNFVTDSCLFIVSLQEPLSEKPSSWKSLATIISIQNKHGRIYPRTNILLYFRKDTALVRPAYGEMIAFIKSPGKIKNFTGAAAFDYQRYCALKNIHYQVFLKPSEFIRLKEKNKDALTEFLLMLRAWVIHTLKKNIPGKKECGLAEALLIGVKDDLDKGLIQSYSNTGVVHVIAISGLHLGLVYALLKFFCIPFKRKTVGRWLAPLIIISGLWLFGLLAGGSPSVLRSAVMFTSIVVGESIARKSSILNNLAASAFFLLCFNPYWLWDLGFQLSYGALLSIVIFMKPVYNLLTIENKIIDGIWKLNAVTIAAQILTMPLLIYYFKQFPNLFLLTNFLAIPLSSIILIGELILCSVHYFETVASMLGKLLSGLIKLMNATVEFLDSFSFSSTKGIEINFMQVVLLYVFITSVAVWLIARHKPGLPAALIAVIIFFVLQTLKIWQ